MMFESGVKAYIYGECTVKVHFPVDFRGNADISCNQCQYFNRNNGTCQLTKEVSEFPLKFVGSKCPLDISGEVLERDDFDK